MKTLDQIRNQANLILLPLQLGASFSDIGTDICIEPHTQKTGNLPKGSFDGMQIIYSKHEGTFEVSEYMAGKEENELHIFKETKSLKAAINCLLKGNKQKPIKIWD